MRVAKSEGEDEEPGGNVPHSTARLWLGMTRMKRKGLQRRLLTPAKKKELRPEKSL